MFNIVKIQLGLKFGIFITFSLLLFGMNFHSKAQDLSNLRQKKIAVASDSLQIDSLSLVPNSLLIKDLMDKIIPDSTYFLDEISAFLIWKIKPKSDSVVLTYRVFPIQFQQEYFRVEKAKRPDSLYDVLRDGFSYQPNKTETPIFDFRGLEKSGSISRGISFGNAQNVVLNSGFNLQVAGKLGNDLNLVASVTDNNVPFQPDGQTQNIQDFDRVFIQVSNKKNRLIVGDYDLNRPESYFSNYFKNVKGAKIDNIFWDKNNKKASQTLSLSAARGKFARQVFMGQEGNQGPYRLRGAEGETFIVILAGSERVFIDGELMKRGEQYDYTIDYNSADLIFTPNRIITNQSRIIVEYEYSNQAFVRTIAYYNLKFESKKLKLNFHTYTESDLKNQPLQQELSDPQKTFLSELGNNTQNSFFPSQRLVNFDANLVQYRRLDTAGFQIFQHISDSNFTQIYQVGFTFVGAGNGDYIQAQSTANGRVFEWQMPDVISGDTIRKGAYSPVIKLITPNKRQLSSLSADWKINKNTKAFLEIARSVQDQNLLSEIGNEDNTAYAIHSKFSTEKKIKLPIVKDVKLKANLGYELLTNNFNIIQPYRNPEFARDWNLEEIYTTTEEHLRNGSLGIYKNETNFLRYEISNFTTQLNNYNALKNRFDYKFTKKYLQISAFNDVSKMSSDDFNSTFARRKIELTSRIKKINFGGSAEQQNNQLKALESDSLLANSFNFNIIEAFVKRPDSSKNNFILKYTFREDFRPDSNFSVLQSTQAGHNFNLGFSLLKKIQHQLSLNSTYRVLNFRGNKMQEETYLGQLEYSGKYFKNFISTNVFFNFGSGQELLRDFNFVPVPVGQGNFQWLDSNKDSIQQINEFVPAFFADSANYIKVFIPGNEFVKTFTNQYNQTLNIKPSRILNKDKKIGKFFGRFSTLSAFSINRKTQNNDPANFLNPFALNLEDSALISTNSQLRNTLFFNRLNPKFGIDLNFQNSLAKNISTNGFATRSTIEQSLKSRYNLSRKLNVELLLKQGEKGQSFEAFSQNNYGIVFQEIEPRINWTIKQNARFTLFYNYQNKINELNQDSETQESAKFHRFTLEVNYNIIKKALIKASFSNVSIDFMGVTSSQVGFELLQGLQPGSNQVWQVSILRTFANNLQLNITYDGRKSENIPVVHIGKVQARILF